MKRSLLIAAALMVICLAASVRAADRDPLPPATQGACPIALPDYYGKDHELAGVAQLLLLSDRWVIVVENNIADVAAKVDELSGGEYRKAMAAWDKSQREGWSDWQAARRRKDLWEKSVARARELAGERKLDAPGFFAIASADDPAYAAAGHPRRVTRYIASLGEGRVPGGPEIDYAHYCYLEMPSPLRNGAHYTITLGNGRRVAFLYDEMRSVSRAIKVNQVGYLPDAPHKYAYLGAYLQEFGPMDCAQAREFHVVSAATGKVVYTGKVTLRAKNPRVAPRPRGNDKPEDRPLACGEDVYEMDFAPLKDEGEFFISVPGVGRSWTFRHAKDAYGEAFYVACRGLYHQRCGIALGPPYTAWPRVKCHTDPVYESQNIPFGVGKFDKPKDYNYFDVIGATIDTTHKTEPMRGGWHDAADWDRNIYHYADVFDLLYAYELAPRKFTDGQLNIPESGNGIPDILDEAACGLEVWKRSMDERGGVAGAVETWTHPKIDAKDVKYAFSRRTRWASLSFAAAAAQYAMLVKPFDAERAKEYESLARKAYAFGAGPRNSLGKVTIEARTRRGQGDPYMIEWQERDGMIVPYLMHAKTRLCLLTGDRAFLDGMPALMRQAPPPYQWPLTYRDYSGWFYFDIANGRKNGLYELVAEEWEKKYCTEAASLEAMYGKQPYRQSWPDYQDYWMGWGATCMTNQARVLLTAWALTGAKDYRDAAALNTDFMLGANPMGMCWTTGLGFVYPIDIQHGPSQFDGIRDPAPGITIYGIAGGMYRALRDSVWNSPGADGKPVAFLNPANQQAPVWRTWSCHPRLNTGQCEFTIHETMASTIFACAMLMSDGWTPSAELKRRQPREDELLFGYYYLP